MMTPRPLFPLQPEKVDNTGGGGGTGRLFRSDLLLTDAVASNCARRSPDGVTGLPSNVTPLLSMAGVWQPIDNQFITQSCTG